MDKRQQQPAQASSPSSLALQIEFKRMEFRWVQTVRCSKARPDLAEVALKEEHRVKGELDALEAEAARLLAETDAKHQQAA